MIGTPAASESFDDAARLRANPAASWGAILAGAVVAVSLSLVLLTLGAGLGFASISPWPGRGVSAGTFTVASTIWLIVTQWLSAAAGGYLAGRLRQRWLATHTHEVFFRDTAHGLVTWSVATLIVAAVLAGSAASLLGGAVRSAGALASAGGQEVAAMGHPEMPRPMEPGAGPDSASGPMGAYNLDKLLRGKSSGSSPELGGQGARAPDARAEVMHIVAGAGTTGEVSDEDRAYLAGLVAAKTGVTTDEAQKRVDAFIQSVKQVIAKAKFAADEARKSAAAAALYTALALLIGAFIASVSAAIGGRLRDEHL
jgi:hypothetical protein